MNRARSEGEKAKKILLSQIFRFLSFENVFGRCALGCVDQFGLAADSLDALSRSLGDHNQAPDPGREIRFLSIVVSPINGQLCDSVENSSLLCISSCN